MRVAAIVLEALMRWRGAVWLEASGQVGRDWWAVRYGHCMLNERYKRLILLIYIRGEIVTVVSKPNEW